MFYANVIQDLRKKFDDNNILLNEPMSKHTTFKIGGNADIFVKVNNTDQIKYILKVAKENDVPFFVLGNGSNILVRDDGIRGIVIKNEMNNIDIEKLNDVEYKVKVDSGVKLGFLSMYLLKNEISGLEFASGIPGTVGGGVKMNAGAYGTEMKDIVYETTYMDRDGNIHIINNNEHNFEYRSSIFSKEIFIILNTTFILKKSSYEEIKKKMDEFLALRKEKQPIGVFSAGSTFKRGTDFITAKLIDDCGLKGYRIGDAEVSLIHSGFIVNRGNASFDDVISLIKYVKEKVYEKYQKTIELEIEII